MGGLLFCFLVFLVWLRPTDTLTNFLQTELQSLQSVSNDSAKLLAEKLALARELNTLRPELEHLKSQLSHQQTVIAEKLALERQLNSLEVELEAEKRSKQRQEDNSELHTRIQELEKKLAAEKKEKERVRKEGERALSEATAQHEMFEQRLETMKLKLRDTREELKKCQAELSDIQTSSINLSDVTEKTVALPAVRKQGKKRRVEEATMEITIPTPGAADQKGKRALKKRGLDVTLANVGEKSTFSITPFLNRTKILENEETDPFDEEEPEHSFLDSKATRDITSVQPPAKIASESVSSASAQPTAKPRGRPRKILGEIPSAKNSNTAKASRKKADDKTKTSKLDLVLEKVVEEAGEDGENEPAPVEAENSVEKETDTEPTVEKKASGVRGRVPARKLKAVPSTEALSGFEPEPKKKKRKLLGGPNKTLFDDDEGETVKKPAPKVSVGGPRPLGKLGVSLGVKQNAFAGKAFSPLKRDRRGVQASFLA